MALPVAMLNGCSSADAAANSNGEGSEEYASTEDALRSKKPKPPCEDAGPAKPKTCAAVLASAFPGEDNYQWEPVAQSKDVVSCCDEELTKNGSSSAFRWSCCVAFDPTVDAGDGNGFNNFGPNGHGMACTPWGPPVPPSMKRGRRANPAIAAWIAKAVA